MSKFAGTGYPNGFNPSTKKPLDVRLIVDSLDERNRIEFTYPGMPVTVLGAALVSGGVTSYPNQTNWRCLVDKQPTFGGYTTQDADWQRDGSGAGAVAAGGSNYKGPWDATANSPDLTDAALLATLKAGDFYRVSVAGNIKLSNHTGWAINDSAFWNGSGWDKFDNTNPVAINPLYTDQQTAQFQTDVLNLIRANIVPEWQPQAYRAGSYVRKTYQGAVLGAPNVSAQFVDTYVALLNMGVNEANLPTTASPNAKWQLLTTTNLALIPGAFQQDDTIGNVATGTFAPTSRTPNRGLSPEEVDARIAQNGGKLRGPLLGGNAHTFLTADVNELAQN